VVADFTSPHMRNVAKMEGVKTESYADHYLIVHKNVSFLGIITTLRVIIIYTIHVILKDL